MNSKTEKKSGSDSRKLDGPQNNQLNIVKIIKSKKDQSVKEICDENLITLEKIHAILKNCINLSDKQKLEFAESERYFMKLYLKELNEELGE